MVVGAREAPCRSASYMSSVGAMSITHSRSTALGMVEREPVRDAAAAVVADDGEALVAERAHQRRHVGGHRALAVAARGRPASPRRLGRVAVAAQVGHDEREARRRAAAPRGATSRASAGSRAAAAAAARRRLPPVRANSSMSPTRCCAALEAVEPGHGVLAFRRSTGRCGSRTARAPSCRARELPLASSAGDQTHSVSRSGTTATMPPPTPLLHGRPIRKANSPAAS